MDRSLYTKMNTYVVINHYILNEELNKMALECIQSFRDTCDAKIISVDDGSPFDTTEIESASDVFIKLPENLGFAKSANAGFNYVLTHFENCYVIYSNNDILVHGAWYGKFIRLLSEGADMVGGLGYRDKEHPPKENDRRYSIGGRLNDWMFPGGFYMTSDKLLREVGIYDEEYIHGSIEDIDLFWRAKQANKRLIMTAGVTYWHKEGATRYSSTLKAYNKEMEKKNIAYFQKKWGFDPIKRLNSLILVDNDISL